MNHRSYCFLGFGIAGAVHYNIALHISIILTTDIHLITWKDLGSVSIWLSLKTVKEVLISWLCNWSIWGRVQLHFKSVPASVLAEDQLSNLNFWNSYPSSLSIINAICISAAQSWWGFAGGKVYVQVLNCLKEEHHVCA